jgi:hypothetical protein
MTPLRKNLDRAKAGYGEIRYRGDLARDVLGAMAVSAPVTHLWRRRTLAIAAAIALSATTFFAGSYFGRGSSSNGEVALMTPAVKTSDPTAVPVPKTTTPNVAPTIATATTTEEFTLVPSLASADDSQTAASGALTSARQSSMDFSRSVPSAPMLFSLATLADQETQTESTNGTQTHESEKRS